MAKTDFTELFLSFYGDDFTGSTDVMESLAMNGLPTALFLSPPTKSEVQNFRLKNKSLSGNNTLKAFGVAGVGRSMSPNQMSTELPPIFEKISKIHTRFFHYKICSTFDSSPETGNIGHAVELALRFFPSRCIPLLVGAPNLNRFCLFGNLFARVDNVTYRLDRHPTMSKHPVTPMHESDLRVHLSRQTKRKIDLIDALMLEEPATAHKKIKEYFSAPSPGFLLFDVLNQTHLRQTGKLLMENVEGPNQLIVGSSGVENAITDYLQQRNEIQKPEFSIPAGKADKLVVMAGSCSPATAKQIEWARNNGFECIRINTKLLADQETQRQEIERVTDTADGALQSKNVVLYTALGPEDPAIEETNQKLKKLFPQGFTKDYLAKLQGAILKTILNARPNVRVTVAGGDTSGHVTLALEIWALEVLAPIAPGAPLCLAHSRNPLFDGLQIALKGGQNGDEKYFGSILMGHKLD